MKPVLYSFRRCPYAIRARLAISVSQTPVELREVVLRDKPPSFLNTSPSATVPCLVDEKNIIDESLEIMKWALKKNDPNGWLLMPQDGWSFINNCDGPFKSSLDKTKYASRYPEANPSEERDKANSFLEVLNSRLDPWLFDHPTIADYAILPFIRQFAFVDKAAFQSTGFTAVRKWLDLFLASEEFSLVMNKYPPWQEESVGLSFP